MANLIETDSPFLVDLDFNNLDAANQAAIEALIDVASVLIEKECNRKFAQDTYTEEAYDGDDLNNLFLKNFPIASIDEVIISPDSTAELTFDGDNFNFKEATGEIWFKSLSELDTPPSNYLGYFPIGRKNILVTYTGGFSDGVPSPIQKLCADLVINSFSPGDVSGNIESEKLGQYFVKFKKDVMINQLMDSKRIISLYKVRKV